MKILFLPGSYTSPSARFRLIQFVEPLQQLGHHVCVRVIRPNREWASSLSSPSLSLIHNKAIRSMRVAHALWLLRDAADFDLIVMNRDIVPEVNIRFIEPWLAKRNPNLVFDFDDAIQTGSRGEKLRNILPYFAWITPGNENLALYASQLHNKVTIIPTVVNTDFYVPVAQRMPGPIRVGWSGSRSSVKHNLPFIKEIIVELSKVENFEFIVIADINPKLSWPGVNIRYIQWTPETEVNGLQQIDIGLMPLEDQPFERGKCGLKAIQYMGVGVPTLVSPVGANSTIVVHETTGFHCTTTEEWFEALRLLIHNEDLRSHMGFAARIHVEENYSVKSALPKIVEIFERVISKS